jgi:hypothetical protein
MSSGHETNVSAGMSSSSFWNWASERRARPSASMRARRTAAPRSARSTAAGSRLSSATGMQSSAPARNTDARASSFSPSAITIIGRSTPAFSSACGTPSASKGGMSLSTRSHGAPSAPRRSALLVTIWNAGS